MLFADVRLCTTNLLLCQDSWRICRVMSDQFSEAKEQSIREIARRHLRIGTLEVRNRDALDFHDCSVASIQDALELAYNAGYTAAMRDAK